MQTVIDANTVEEMFGLTGTAGFFCCGPCQNVTSTARHNPRCVHYACVDPSMFGTHMHTTFIELCDVVVNGAAEMDKTELRLVQKCTGPSWPHGCVAFGRYARKLPDMANLIYCGCIGQFTLNARAVILTRRGFTLKQLDAMAQAVKLPRCWGTQHPKFFQERVDMPSRGHECEGHVKAFSNEVLAGTRILGSSCHLLEILTE